MKVLLIFDVTTTVYGANISQHWLPKQSVHNLDKSRFLVVGLCFITSENTASRAKNNEFQLVL